MIDGLDGIGDAVGDMVAGAGQVLVAAADVLQHAVWMGPATPEKPEAGKAPAETEEGP